MRTEWGDWWCCCRSGQLHLRTHVSSCRSSPLPLKIFGFGVALMIRRGRRKSAELNWEGPLGVHSHIAIHNHDMELPKHLVEVLASTTIYKSRMLQLQSPSPSSISKLKLKMQPYRPVREVASIVSTTARRLKCVQSIRNLWHKEFNKQECLREAEAKHPVTCQAVARNAAMLSK